jgi:hypothetical protein
VSYFRTVVPAFFHVVKSGVGIWTWSKACSPRCKHSLQDRISGSKAKRVVAVSRGYSSYVYGREEVALTVHLSCTIDVEIENGI